MYRPWAFWRRVQYGAGVGAFFLVIFALIYASYIHTPASCFDGRQNGNERGVDCGGACARVCAFDTAEPSVLWSRAFRVTDGLYNAVAYIENTNLTFGTPELGYTFTLYDEGGSVITERSGTTVLLPDSINPIFEGRIAVGNKIPTRTFIELAPIDEWQEVDAGRDQFTVRDRELIRADSEPRLDTTLFNTSLEDERDLEIVATIFDARGNALTASRSIVPLFEGREERNVVFTWPEPIAKTVRSCEVPTDVILAIDLSGSMNDDGGTPPQPISSVLDAASSFVSRLRSRDQVGVVTFATHADLTSGLTNSLGTAEATVQNLSIAPQEETGRTNIGDAIALANNEFLSPRHSRDARKVLVLLTDGRANAPGEDAEKYAVSEAAGARASDIDIFTIGLGQGVNRPFLGDVASSNNHEFYAASAANLDQIYRLISTAICEEGAAVIDVIPKTTAGF